MIDTPAVDWAGLSPYLALLGGASVVLLGAVFVREARRNAFGAAVATLALLGAGAAAIVLFTLDDEGTGIISDAIRRDRLAELAQVIVVAVGLLAVLVSYRE